jgi:hypothetical protein
VVVCILLRIAHQMPPLDGVFTYLVVGLLFSRVFSEKLYFYL